MTAGLGDRAAAALKAVGVTEERVSRWLGAPCNCRARREKLNALGAWAARGAGATREYLAAIIGGDLSLVQEQTVSDYATLTACRVCGGTELTPALSLGEHYLSDFVPPGQAAAVPKAPLELVLCRGPSCGLLQLKHTVNQERLYRHYHYRSGTTRTMRDALKDVVESALRRVKLDDGDVVLDIGSNDGTLLGHYPPNLFKVGFEPAKNLTEVGFREASCFIGDFWSYARYKSEWALKDTQAKVVTACGMLYDLPNPHDFLRDVAMVLHPDGLFIAQLMMFRDMLAVGDVGNLCHEHLEHYSFRAFNALLAAHGLEVEDCETNAVNGQSTRFYIRHAGKRSRVSVNFMASLVFEEDRGYSEPGFYEGWAAHLDGLREQLYDFVLRERTAGKRFHLYGASTKSSTVLQWVSLDARQLDYAADRDERKWGKVTSGTGIPIVAEQTSREQLPDYYWVGPWGFLPEFVEREKQECWWRRGGKFLVPLPTPRLVGKDGEVAL